MSTSSILTTTQLDRSLFSAGPGGAVSVGLGLGLRGPSEAETEHFVTSGKDSYTGLLCICVFFRQIFHIHRPVLAEDSLADWGPSVCGPGNPKASVLLWYSCSSLPAHWA